MTYRQYTREQLHTLFQAIDQNLATPAEMILIGGAAALLAYHVTGVTHDVDVLSDLDDIESAYNQAKERTGLDIPLSRAGVAEGPYQFEERLQEYNDVRLEKLTIWVPEIYDLILMKTLRADQHDLEVIEEIARNNQLSPDTLIKRFENEMRHVMGNKTRLRINFSAVLARCFGEDVAENWMDS